MEYRHVQTTGGLLALFIVFTAVSIGSVFVADTGAGLVTLAFCALITGVLAVFSRLEVMVTAGRVRVAFGWGWPRRAIDLNAVRAVRAVRNKWYYGWGIRKIPRGWMYNVWGLDAVELELDSGKLVRIGTDEPDELLGVLSLQVG